MSDSMTAIITGAGSGVGRDTSLLLAEVGFNLVLVGRTGSKLQDTAEAVADQSPKIETLIVTADLTDEDAPQTVIDKTLERLERIDALSNNAGAAVSQPISQTDYKTWRQVIDVNLTAPIMLTSLALPVMQKQKNGIIVNISSMAAFDPFPGFGLYAPAKAGVNMFTLCTGREAKKIGVKAVAIAPGAIETPLLRSMFNEKMVPEDKSLDPMAVAAVIRDCVTGKRDFNNGETIEMPSP